MAQAKRKLQTKTEPTGEIAQINEFERIRTLPSGIEIHEEKVVRERTRGDAQEFWQPVGKMVPVLLISNTATFTPRHEQVLRSEPNVDRDHRDQRKIWGALKRHDADGEIYFEMGRTDEETDDVIKYAIDLLKGYGIQARREMRWTTYLSRAEW